MYSSITATRCSSVDASKLFSPGTTSITNARGSSTQPYTCATGMPSASSSCWNRISCSSGKSGAASVRSPRTITVVVLAVALDVDEPHRSPARLLADGGDLGPEVFAAPVGEQLIGAVHVHPRASLRPMIPFMISVVPP